MDLANSSFLMTSELEVKSIYLAKTLDSSTVTYILESFMSLTADPNLIAKWFLMTIGTQKQIRNGFLKKIRK